MTEEQDDDWEEGEIPDYAILKLSDEQAHLFSASTSGMFLSSSQQLQKQVFPFQPCHVNCNLVNQIDVVPENLCKITFLREHLGCNGTGIMLVISWLVILYTLKENVCVFVFVCEIDSDEELPLIKHGEAITDRRSTFQPHLALVVTPKQVQNIYLQSPMIISGFNWLLLIDYF